MPVQRLEAVLVVEDDIAAVAVAGVLRDDDLAVIRGIDRRAFVHGEVHAAVQAAPAVLERRGERVAVQRHGEFSGADADIARADLNNFVGGLPEHGARKDGARALLTVHGFNLGGNLRCARTALLNGLTIGLVLIFVLLRHGVERNLLGVGDSAGRGHVQALRQGIIQRGIGLCKRGWRNGLVHADGLQEAYVFVCRCRVRGLDPVERGLSAVRVGGNGGLSAVYRNDGKRVQLAAGGNEIVLEFLLRQQGSGCPHRPGLQAQRQVIVRAGNSGCAGFNRVYCVQQRCAVLDNTERLTVRKQQRARPGQQQSGQQEQQSEYAQRTDRTAAASLPQNTGEPAPDRQVVYAADRAVEQQDEPQKQVEQA